VSFINSANPGSQIELMSIIYRVLNRSSSVKEDRLMELCNPATLAENDNQAKKFPDELRFWSEPDHQLWEKDNSGSYSLIHRPYAGKDPGPSDIAAVVRSMVMGMKFFSVIGNEDGFAKFIALLSCILVAPEHAELHAGQVINNNALRSLQERYLPIETHANSSELGFVLAYAHFFGFLVPSPTASGDYYVDPTEVVRRVLIHELAIEQSMTIRDCVELLAQKIPVFDGGKFRIEVEETMEEKGGFQPPHKDYLSRSLSHAFYRLRSARTITLKELSDDPEQIIFDLPKPIGNQKYSQLALLEK